MAAKFLQRLSVTDEDIRWSKQGRQELKELVFKLSFKASGHGQDPPRILFMGETGSGKSSFISSIVSALKGHIVYTSTVGEKEGDEVNTSKRYLEHRVFIATEDGSRDEPLNFILCDSRGIAKRNQQGAAETEIKRLIDGKMRHGDLIDDERGDQKGREVDSRISKPPSCVVFVQKARGLGEKDPDVQYKMDLASKMVREKGIPSVVILTHIDMVKENLKSKLHQALTSKKIKERVDSASRQTGVNINRVYVVKNYVDEYRTHVRNDILILRALCGILRDVDQINRDRLSRQWEREGEREEHRRQAGNHSQAEDSAYSSMGHSFSDSHTDTEDSRQISRPQRGQAGPAQRTEPSRQSARRRLTQPKKIDSPELKQTTDPPLTRRSGTYDYHIKREDSPETKVNQSSSSDEIDKQNDYDDDDIDDGISTTGTFVSIHSTKDKLQQLINSMTTNPYPDNYKERANLRGAKALHRKTVYQLNQSDITTSSDNKTTGLNQELQKYYLVEDFYVGILDQLQDWSKTSTGAVWMSDTLHFDLGLPMSRLPPNSVDFQVLFLAPGHPAFLLTVFDPERVLQDEDIDTEEKSRKMISHETKEVELFTMRMGKLLTSAAFTFCSCDFVLVPCTMAFKDFSSRHLECKLKEQVELTRQYFHGPRVLRDTTYMQLKAAMTAVVGGSHAPKLLDGKSDCSLSDERNMVLMDLDWRGVVTLLIEKLTRCDSHEKVQNVTYPEKCWIKMAAAVMEASKRLSFAEQVVIVTDNETMIECCRPFKEMVKKETGLDLHLIVTHTSPNLNEITPNYVIIIDLPVFCVPQNTVTLHITRNH